MIRRKSHRKFDLERKKEIFICSMFVEARGVAKRILIEIRRSFFDLFVAVVGLTIVEENVADRSEGKNSSSSSIDRRDELT